MKPYGLSTNALAITLRTDAILEDVGIGEIIKCKRSVTADTALRLASLFKITPQFWLNLQTDYDLSLQENELKSDL